MNGNLMMPKEIFSNNVYKVLKGKQLKVTSFENRPFTYKNTQGQYEGYEVSLINDLSESLDFSWYIAPPADGALWGEINSDGNATGLVGELKV